MFKLPLAQVFPRSSQWDKAVARIVAGIYQTWRGIPYQKRPTGRARTFDPQL